MVSTDLFITRDIMSLVIEQHLKSAVSRLGFRASYRYSHSDVF